MCASTLLFVSLVFTLLTHIFADMTHLDTYPLLTKTLTNIHANGGQMTLVEIRLFVHTLSDAVKIRKEENKIDRQNVKLVLQRCVSELTNSDARRILAHLQSFNVSRLTESIGNLKITELLLTQVHHELKDIGTDTDINNANDLAKIAEMIKEISQIFSTQILHLQGGITPPEIMVYPSTVDKAIEKIEHFIKLLGGMTVNATDNL